MDSIDTKFQKELLQFKGLKCWSVVAGIGSGSRVGLDFGGKIKRRRPLKNQMISEEARLYKGEFSLFLEDCTWRLESQERVMCSSKSENAEGGEMLSELRSLIGLTVNEFQVFPLSHDLILEFDRKLLLRAFCDCVDEEDGDNYTIFTPSDSFTIGPKGGIFLSE